MSKKERLTDEELLAQFEGLGNEDAAGNDSKPSTGDQNPDDILEELNLPERPKSANRPQTPRTATTSASKSSPKRTGSATPTTNDGARSSDEKARSRKSGESTRSFHNSFTPASSGEGDSDLEKSASTATEPAQTQSLGGGWWGSVFSTASAAVKQAEALAKEIRQNEEAQRWAEQVKGNVGALRGFGGELRSRALPTFTNILHTLAPPISSHERLQIHITHDLVGYPSLDPLVYTTFSRVMAQVEGGDLMVVQRGQESTQRRGSDAAYKGSLTSSTGWSDGPWWRQATETRSLGAVKGLTEGTKLSKASAESYANDFFASLGGVEEAAKHATEVLSESNPVRSSDIFLAIQAISQISPSDLFGGTSSEQQQKASGGDVVEPTPDEDETAEILFAIYLHDPIHGITFTTLTQSLPQKWISWLDASAIADPSASGLPPEIAEIVESGGVDPREWVSEWVEELLALGVGILAQKYVARRMGVGQGGIGKGKARQEALEGGGGEAARAV